MNKNPEISVIMPVFNGEKYEDKLLKYDELEDADDEMSQDLIQRLVYYISFWYAGRVGTREDFEALDEDAEDYGFGEATGLDEAADLADAPEEAKEEESPKEEEPPKKENPKRKSRKTAKKKEEPSKEEPSKEELKKDG